MDFGSIRAVLFDLDGTLYRQRPLRLLMGLELCSLPLYGPLRASSRLAAIRAFRGAQERLRAQSGGDPTSLQIDHAARSSGLPVAEVKVLVSDWMERRPLKYLQFCRAPGLDDVLRAIDDTGRRAGILSDYPARPKLAALGVSGRFDPVLSAGDPSVPAFKPDPRGYLRACEIWGLGPAEVLFVGDRPDVDAAGAAAAGMPCAIVGRRAVPAAAGYLAFESLEKLSRVLAPHTRA